MDAAALTLNIVLLGSSIFMSALLPKYWRSWPELDRPQLWWVFGDEAWRAFRRTYAVCAVGAWVIALGTLLLPYMPLHPPESLPFAVPFGATFLLVFIFINTIWCWNWPKILVPPRFRNERGTLSGLTDRVFRRGQRARDGGSRRDGD